MFNVYRAPHLEASVFAVLSTWEYKWITSFPAFQLFLQRHNTSHFKQVVKNMAHRVLSNTEWQLTWPSVIWSGCDKSHLSVLALGLRVKIILRFRLTPGWQNYRRCDFENYTQRYDNVSKWSHFSAKAVYINWTIIHFSALLYERSLHAKSELQLTLEQHVLYWIDPLTHGFISVNVFENIFEICDDLKKSQVNCVA